MARAITSLLGPPEIHRPSAVPPQSSTTSNRRILIEAKQVELEKLNASKNRKEKRIMMATKAIERYNHDPDYKYLHECVSDLFVELLRSAIKLLTTEESSKISLAVKWCPSLDSSFDESTLICESIAKKVFPRAEFIEKALELPEVYIGQNQWHLIPYNRVASVAMKFYKEKFLKHDRLRFQQHLENVRSGKDKIAAGALFPHEIISSLEDYDGGQVAELQWKRMVEDMSKKGKLNNYLAICDVSGSMSGIPMEVCISLGVLVSELSEQPWKGKVITFSKNPKLSLIQGDGLRSKIQFVRKMEWGMNTDFQKVFDLILEVASNCRLTQQQMIKRVFVFSDMEFDVASVNPWETDYQVIKRKFPDKGYGCAVPEMVFWKLRDSRAAPVAANDHGVALVSGFSKNLMALFMEDGGRLNPEGVMVSAICGGEYKKLVVVD
ncbi:hypothetical protein R6Q57_007621 [Mikania cordata]